MDAAINFRLPAELKERLEILARRSLISVADVARIAVLEKLERDAPTTSQPEAAAIGENSQ